MPRKAAGTCVVKSCEHDSPSRRRKTIRPTWSGRLGVPEKPRARHPVAAFAETEYRALAGAPLGITQSTSLAASVQASLLGEMQKGKGSKQEGQGSGEHPELPLGPKKGRRGRSRTESHAGDVDEG